MILWDGWLFYQMVTMEMNLCMFELGITIHRRDESQIKKKKEH